MTKQKFAKFWKRVDKVVFWIDFEEIKKHRIFMVVLLVIFFTSIVWGPLLLVAVTAFLQEINR